MPPSGKLDQAKLFVAETARRVGLRVVGEDVGGTGRAIQEHHTILRQRTSRATDWIIDLVTPSGGAPEVIQELRETLCFKGRP